MLVRMLGDVTYDSAIQVFSNAKKEHREEEGWGGKRGKKFGSPLGFFFFVNWVVNSLFNSNLVNRFQFDLLEPKSKLKLTIPT